MYVFEWGLCVCVFVCVIVCILVSVIMTMCMFVSVYMYVHVSVLVCTCVYACVCSKPPGGLTRRQLRMRAVVWGGASALSTPLLPAGAVPLQLRAVTVVLSVTPASRGPLATRVSLGDFAAGSSLLKKF